MSVLGKNDTESKYVFYHGDGLLDIFIGLGILIAGLFLWSDLVWMVGIFVPVFLPSFQTARKRFLQDRIKDLDYNPQQKARAQKLVLSLTLLLGVFFLAGIGMFLAFDFMSGPVNDWLRQYFLLVLGIIFGSVWGFAGAMLNIVRFYLYGALTFVLLSAAQLMAMPFWLALAVLGGLIIIIGLMMFARFLRQYPVIK